MPLNKNELLDFVLSALSALRSRKQPQRGRAAAHNERIRQMATFLDISNALEGQAYMLGLIFDESQTAHKTLREFVEAALNNELRFETSPPKYVALGRAVGLFQGVATVLSLSPMALFDETHVACDRRFDPAAMDAGLELPAPEHE